MRRRNLKKIIWVIVSLMVISTMVIWTFALPNS